MALAELLRQESGLQVLLDKPALEEKGVEGDEEVTLPGQLPWSLALGHALGSVEDVQLSWYLDKNTVFVTTVAQAEVQFHSRTFNTQPVMDYWRLATPNNGLLFLLIQDNNSGTWHEEDDESAGEIHVVGNVLIVRQTWRGMNETATMMEALVTPGRLIWVNRPREDEAILAALDKPVPAALVGRRITLGDLADSVELNCKIPVKLDHAHLQEEGILKDVEVLVELGGQSLRDALGLALADILDVELAAIVDKGVLSLTTRAYARTFFQCIMLDVADLAPTGNRGALIQAIMNHTSGIWKDDVEDWGGSINITPEGRLVIRQTDQAIHEILELVRQIRAQFNSKPAAPLDPQSIETRYYRSSSPAARGLLQAIPQHVDPGSWNSKTDQPPVGLISLVDIREHAEAIPATVLQSSIGTGSIGPSSVLIIRQTVANHQKIEAMLLEMGVWWGTSRAGEGPSFGGGFPWLRQ